MSRENASGHVTPEQREQVLRLHALGYSPTYIAVKVLGVPVYESGHQKALARVKRIIRNSGRGRIEL